MIPFFLNCTKGFGFTVEDIENSCPAEMMHYVRAHRADIEEKDMYIWNWTGSYGISALVFAIDHCLNGKKASTEYVKAPVIDGKMKEQIEKNNKERQLQEFVASLETMKANFEAAHPEKKRKRG